VIKHIVMWNVRGDSAQAKARGIDELKRGFEGLRGQVPGLLHLEIGVDSSGIDYACDVASHPAHVRLRKQLADLRTARHQVDYAAHKPKELK
jgi:hypothetical protein